MCYKRKIIWNLLFLSFLFFVFDAVGDYFNFKITSNYYFEVLKYSLPVLAILFHSIELLGTLKTLLFFFLSFSIGFIFEILGLNFGASVGCSYVYNMNFFSILRLPIIIPFYWFALMYTVYSFTNSFFAWKGKKYFSDILQNKWFYLIFLDAYFIVIIDLILDPIMFNLNQWIWLQKGLYFNIPLCNFFAWFIITLISMGIFRYYESKSSNFNFNFNLYLVPVLGYFSIFLILLILLFILSNYLLIWIELFLFIPLFVFNFVLLYRKK